MIKNLQKIRKLRNYSQKKLAELTNLTRDTIASYEIGRQNPSLENLIKLANVLNCSTDYLLGLKETEN